MPEVPTTAGFVRGQWEKPVAVFRGIPYAQTPLGPYRFARPDPLKAGTVSGMHWYSGRQHPKLECQPLISPQTG
ncbi:hypothetical protein MAUB1S_00906 [Mycolicibacterium aubagnense]